MHLLNQRRLSTSDIILLAMTRGMLGAGIGLLVARKLTDEQRRAVGRTLTFVGAVTTVPLAIPIFGHRQVPAALGT